MEAPIELTLGGLSLCVIPTRTLQAIRREAIAACALAPVDGSTSPLPPGALAYHTAVIQACEQHLLLRARRAFTAAPSPNLAPPAA